MIAGRSVAVAAGLDPLIRRADRREALAERQVRLGRGRRRPVGRVLARVALQLRLSGPPG